MRISLPNKVTLFVSTLFFFSVVSLSFLVVKTTAQVPDPTVPCDETSNPEFNALRPYQASPCGDYNIALFCGNQINIVETKSVTRRGIHLDGLPVDWWNGGSPAGKDYWIDLSETELPILGNTELTKNSQSGQDQIDDATKLNEYVSWYLNGVNNKAEYGSEKNTATEIINYSGPLQKLLPSIIQDAQRIATVASASAATKSTEDDDDPPPSDSEPYTHNQIVVCASRQILGLIGKMVPHECYDGNGGSARETVYRLKDWDNHLPPLPWDKEYAGNEEAYKKARCEWEGGSYLTIPVINKKVCIDNPFNSNAWADLFSYVPLATTPDKKGKMPIFTVTIQPAAADMDTHSWVKLAAPTLFYPHTQEVKDLSETLNKTYLPEGVTVSEIPYETTEKNDFSSDPKCRVLNVRSNPGDDLFPIRKPADVGTNVVFHVNMLYNCHVEYRTNDDGTETPYTTCSGQVAIGIQTDPNKIPYVDDIWKTTVAGNASTFRKIFPKVGEGAPVTCIADIPGVTKAVYRPVAGTDSIGVEGPLGSIDQENMDPENAKIYFSHLGGIYEYFLKGIQTALRPQGFGEPITNGEFCETIEKEECDVNVPDSAVDSKYLGTFKSNFIDLANRWTAGCGGPENNLAEECYNYVASEAKKGGVNPAFALTIWLNESGASNYCFGGETTQDLGINLPDLYQDISGQLRAFISMAKQKLCDGDPGFVEPMHGWLSRFQSSAGVCDPGDQTATDYYYGVMGTTWSYLTNCVKNGQFGITWPTDMSCP